MSLPGVACVSLGKCSQYPVSIRCDEANYLVACLSVRLGRGDLLFNQGELCNTISTLTRAAET